MSDLPLVFEAGAYLRVTATCGTWLQIGYRLGGATVISRHLYGHKGDELGNRIVDEAVVHHHARKIELRIETKDYERLVEAARVVERTHAIQIVAVSGDGVAP
jgi:hypothetical protein